MSISRKRAIEYAQELLSRPSSKVPVELRRGKNGLSILVRERVITKCHNTKPGNLIAPHVAQALGVELPAEGQSTEVETTTGVLHRAIGISMLDLRHAEERIILQQLLEEAENLRTLKGSTSLYA